MHRYIRCNLCSSDAPLTFTLCRPCYSQPLSLRGKLTKKERRKKEREREGGGRGDERERLG